MKIGIISDSHDDHKNVLKAIKVFNEQGVDYVFHAGDMVSPFTVRALAEGGSWKFIAVLGNCDGDKLLFESTVEQAGGEVHERVYTGCLADRQIFMTHIPGTLREVVDSGNFDLVIYGHTHKQDIRREGKTLVINPGESTDQVTGQSHTVVVELDDMSVQIIRLNK